MRRALFMIFVLAAALLTTYLTACSEKSTEPKPEPKRYLSLHLSVADSIQTYDAWTSGSTQVNEWAKPIYRIWFDMNGKPEDGPFGNGSGVKQAEIYLDNGVVGFWWRPSTGGELRYWPVFNISMDEQECYNIEGRITEDCHTLDLCFPLEKIGDPATLEIGVMASPWTTSASDCFGSGNGLNEWLIIDNARQTGSWIKIDATGDNTWPQKLQPQKKGNFDITKLEVTIEEK